MQYDEKIVKAALSLILDVVAEDKQKIKEQQTRAIEHLQAENKDLREIAEKYIRKCDKLTTLLNLKSEGEG